MSDNAVIPDAIFPEFAELGALEGFADQARIVEARDTLMQEFENALGNPTVKLREAFFGLRRKLNPPRHSVSSVRPAEPFWRRPI
jgi:hypothetical protein